MEEELLELIRLLAEQDTYAAGHASARVEGLLIALTHGMDVDEGDIEAVIWQAHLALGE